MTKKYFRISPTKNDELLSVMNSESGFPSNVAERWFPTAAELTKDSNGMCVIALRPPISDRFTQEGIEEITEEEFTAIQVKES
jgi:hypothetical protein